MTRRHAWGIAAVVLWLATAVALAACLGGCQLSLGFDPSKAGPGAGEAVSAVGAATGNPLLVAAGAALSLFATYKAAAAKAAQTARAEDDAPHTERQADNLEATLARRGWKKG